MGLGTSRGRGRGEGKGEGERLTMGDDGIFEYQYERFHHDRDQAKGYDFQQVPGGSLPVPKVTFSERLRWWTIDRWRRRKKIREERDRRLQEILDVKNRRALGFAWAVALGMSLLVTPQPASAQAVQTEEDRRFLEKQAKLDLRRMWRFDDEQAGGVPNGFVSRTVGAQSAGSWQVVADSSAASAPNVLKQEVPCTDQGCFHLLLAEGVSYDYLDLTFKLRPAAGSTAGIGGVVFNARDEHNFYAVLVDFNEQRLAVLRVEDGKETVLGRAPVTMKEASWHIVRVQRNTIISKEFIETFFDNALAVSVEDQTFGAGQIGLTTRGGAPVEFDNIHAIRIYSQRPLSAPAAY